jgi:hypothetical protein
VARGDLPPRLDRQSAAARLARERFVSQVNT